jgi:endoglucanase
MVVAGTFLALTASSTFAASGSLPPDTRFYTPPPNAGATDQIADLKAAGRTGAARKIRAMIRTPQAVWFTEGSPRQARRYMRETVADANSQGSVPVVVAYNVPGRDCSLYSAGGAANGNAYRAWIDALVTGLGSTAAVVIIEPDGLANLPSDCGQADPYDREALIRYAAHAFLADPNAQIYIDAGNSNWNPVGLMARRLADVGVLDIDGFALNVSSYQFTGNSNQYGTWVSKCITYGTEVDPGNFNDCPDQYGSWGGVALSPWGRWSNGSSNPELNTSAENARYADLLHSARPTAHFVVDTSRNAVGPWPGTNAHPASNSDTEDWCNPPDRGAGKRPTADTSVALVDAYVWVKIPGESDGECFRWTNGPNDPYRGMADPSAGVWFPEMALELARNAVPSLP